MLLRRSGRTVEELARELGLTDNGVRAHPAILERDGIVWQRGSVRRGSGGGKLAYVYELTSEADGLRTGARPVSGCSGRAVWTGGIGGTTEVGRSSFGGRQDRTDRRHSRPARGGRRRAQGVGCLAEREASLLLGGGGSR
jgi:hypothetical protein